MTNSNNAKRTPRKPQKRKKIAKKKKVDLFNKKGEFTMSLKFGKAKAICIAQKDSGINLNNPSEVKLLLSLLSEAVFDEWFRAKHLTYKGVKDSSDKLMLWKMPKGSTTKDVNRAKKLLKK